jgi:SRSO17 transposase
VSLSIANHHASLPIAYRLYLTVEWAADAARRKKAPVPKDIEFQTKPEIALEQIRAACEAGIARGVVLMDAGYGANTELRTGISALGLTYVAGILPQTRSGLPPRRCAGPSKSRDVDDRRSGSVVMLSFSGSRSRISR